MKMKHFFQIVIRNSYFGLFSFPGFLILLFNLKFNSYLLWFWLRLHISIYQQQKRPCIHSTYSRSHREAFAIVGLCVCVLLVDGWMLCVVSRKRKTYDIPSTLRHYMYWRCENQLKFFVELPRLRFLSFSLVPTVRCVCLYTYTSMQTNSLPLNCCCWAWNGYFSFFVHHFTSLSCFLCLSIPFRSFFFLFLLYWIHFSDV